MSDIASAVAVEPRKKSGGACCLYGCLGAVGAVVIVLLVAYLGVTRVAIPRILDRYTASEPIVLPRVNMTADEIAAVEGRWKAFLDKMDGGEPADIQLTSAEMNALIQHNAEWEGLRDVVYVDFKPGVVRGQLSLDLGRHWRLARGRYFTGRAAFGVTVEDGRLDIRVREVTVRGRSVAQAGEWLSDVNLADSVYEDSEQDVLVRRLRRVNRLEFVEDRVLVEVNQP